MKRFVIILEQKFDVLERYGRGHINTKIERDVRMPESTVRNIIKHAGEIKEKGKVASVFSGLRTSARNRSVNNDRHITVDSVEGHLHSVVFVCTQVKKVWRLQVRGIREPWDGPITAAPVIFVCVV
jgi:hypothetical protein